MGFALGVFDPLVFPLPFVGPLSIAPLPLRGFVRGSSSEPIATHPAPQTIGQPGDDKQSGKTNRQNPKINRYTKITKTYFNYTINVV